MPIFPVSSLRSASEELEEIRGGYLLGPAELEIWHRCLSRRAKECFLGLLVQEQLHSNAEEAKGLLLVQCAT